MKRLALLADAAHAWSWPWRLQTLLGTSEMAATAAGVRDASSLMLLKQGLRMGDAAAAESRRHERMFATRVVLSYGAVP